MDMVHTYRNYIIITILMHQALSTIAKKINTCDTTLAFQSTMSTFMVVNLGKNNQVASYFIEFHLVIPKFLIPPQRRIPRMNTDIKTHNFQ